MVKVSVIIPVYNKEQRLPYSIESVLNQTYKDFELILINDGSTDSSKSIINKYIDIDNRIVFIDQENKGVSTTRNNGILASKGTYVSFLDADDLWDENFLEKMIYKIGDNNVCYCGHNYSLDNIVKKARNVKFQEGDILESFIYNKTAPHTNSWLIKRKYLEQNNIFFPTNLNWGEDMCFFSEVLYHENNVKCVDEYLTVYYLNQENSLSDNNIDKINKDLKWMELAIQNIRNRKKNTSRDIKVIRAFHNYRIPTAIIYRINDNIGIISKEILKSKFKEYSSLVGKLNFSNRLRSIKLNVYYIKLYIYFNI